MARETRGFTRRSILSGLAGALVGVVGFAYPGLARVVSPESGRATPAPLPISGVDPSFKSGTVSAVTSDSVVLTSAEGTRTVHIVPGRTIWKEFDVTIDDVKVGDRVMAKGDPQPDGSLRGWPGHVYVNIGLWRGVITELQPNAVVVKHPKGVSRLVVFSPRLEVIRASDLRPIGVPALVPGREIGSVGLFLREEGILRATRIWVEGQ